MNVKFRYIIIIYIILQTSLVYAFDNKQSHPTITDYAITNSLLRTSAFLQDKLGISDGLKHQLKINEVINPISKWVKQGSMEEDEPACRASNHFYNPLAATWNEAQLTDSAWLVDGWCTVTSPFRTKYSNLVWATGIEEKGALPTNPANNYLSEHNGRNWTVARYLFYSALTNTDQKVRETGLAETFKTLGYVLHLLQDVAVPAHVRNDFSQGHTRIIGCPDEGGCLPLGWVGNPFEGYVRDNFSNIKTEIEAANKSISNPFEGKKVLTNFWDTDFWNGTADSVEQTITRNVGLAEYSNANFVSYNTIFKSDTEHYFLYPARESIAAADYPDQINVQIYDVLKRDGKLDKRVYIKKDNHGEIIDHFLAPRYVPYGADYPSDRLDLKFTLDNECFKEYATKLIPRAVGYSASLIDYFFRGSIEIAQPLQGGYALVEDPSQGFTQIIVLAKNTSPEGEDMTNGSIELVIKYRISQGDPFQNVPVDSWPAKGVRLDKLVFCC